MKINEQLCCDAELILSKFQLGKHDMPHILKNYLNWYRNSCKEDDKKNALIYEKLLSDNVKKAKILLCEQKMREFFEIEKL